MFPDGWLGDRCRAETSYQLDRLFTQKDEPLRDRARHLLQRGHEALRVPPPRCLWERGPAVGALVSALMA